MPPLPRTRAVLRRGLVPSVAQGGACLRLPPCPWSCHFGVSGLGQRGVGFSPGGGACPGLHDEARRVPDHEDLHVFDRGLPGLVRPQAGSPRHQGHQRARGARQARESERRHRGAPWTGRQGGAQAAQRERQHGASLVVPGAREHGPQEGVRRRGHRQKAVRRGRQVDRRGEGGGGGGVEEGKAVRGGSRARSQCHQTGGTERAEQAHEAKRHRETHIRLRRVAAQ
mmetsp:Transcript_27491/g.61424  ORF Transcript_27491/g.61424 Transcript_27491/m.61424 type:complete len:226 (-) Transcript_27491:4167-4844(-)